LVALFGLNTWRRQLRGQRQLEHAEKALAAGKKAFIQTRAVRGRFSQYAPEDMADKATQQAAYERMIAGRFDRAWTAWTQFADHYLLVGLFAPPNPKHADIAEELASCLLDLSGNAEMMFLYSQYAREDGADASLRTQLVGFRKGFYGTPEAGSIDPIEARLRQAEKSLDAELRPTLVPPRWWARLRPMKRTA
jgi:hypothetical protein